MRRLLFLILLVTLSCLQIYGQLGCATFPEGLSKDLELLSAYPYGAVGTEEDNLLPENLDPDSLVGVIVSKVKPCLQSMKTEVFMRNRFPEIPVINGDEKTSFYILDYSYNSGGSAGIIPKPLIVKKEKDSLNVFDLTHTECAFSEFYKLKENTYICIGYSQGGSFCWLANIYVIDFGGTTEKYVPAFGNSSHFSICNSDVSYNETDRLLRIETESIPYPAGKDCKDYFREESAGYFSVECEEYECEAFSAILTARYNGTEFVKPTSP